MNKAKCISCENIKKYRNFYIVAILSFVLGFLFKMLISSPSTICSAAVVDVQQLINNASSVRELQAEMSTKQQELQKWIKEAQINISKTAQKSKKDELIKKYDEELAQKQQELQNEYAQKLSDIDHKMTKLIKKEAKAEGFDIILAKSAVISGGTDITNEIIEVVK